MKIEVFKDPEKKAKYILLLRRMLPQIVVAIIIVVNISLAVWVLFPREDKIELEAGSKRLKALDITFNMKTLTTLKKTKTPAGLNVTGGRDPFSNF